MTNMAAFERRNQCGLVGQRSARCVDVYDALLHPGDTFGREKSARLVSKRQVHRHDIGAREQRVDVNEWYVDLGVSRAIPADYIRSEEHTSELQSHVNLVCRLLLEKKKHQQNLSACHFKQGVTLPSVCCTISGRLSIRHVGIAVLCGL